jgi:hypothetical protein
VLAWQVWRMSKLAAVALVPLLLLLGYGLNGLL